jgi:hypothetical protein
VASNKEKRIPDKPTVHPTDTGGLRIDSEELFTTQGGQRALRQLMDIDFTRNGSKNGSSTNSKEPDR